jgi:predicted DCC family thiol-disulfide oxidoreductase YuxK
MTGIGPKIIYDGDCPFCASYVGLLRLRETYGEVEVMNARECPELVEELARRNLDLDDGMVLALNGEYFHGSECVHRLALLASRSNAFNTINKWIFERKKVAAVLYPFLRAGRNLSLRILGIKKIGLGVRRRPGPPATEEQE